MTPDTTYLPPRAGVGDKFVNFGSTFVLLLPYLEESALYEGYDFHEAITHPANLPTTTATIGTFICPSMQPPTYHGTDGGEVFGYGSYLISTRTEYFKNKNQLDKPEKRPDGAFDSLHLDGGYQLSLKNITDGASHTLLMGEINYAYESLPAASEPMPTVTNDNGAFAWAQGYWALGWGHMATTKPILFNNSDDYGGIYGRRTFRSDHPGGVNFVFLDGSVHFITDDSDPELRRALVTRAGEEILSDSF